MRTKEQERARGAHKAVKAIDGDPAKTPKFKKEYGGLCLDLAPLILKNGLCQTVAFYQAKSKREHFKLLLRDFALVCSSLQADAYAARVRDADVAGYQQMTHEALACAQWFKRYAEAVLRAVPGDQGSNG